MQKSDDKKQYKIQIRKMFTKIGQLIMLCFLISVLFYTDICTIIFLSNINDEQIIKKFLLASLAIFPDGMQGWLGFHPARPMQKSSAQGRNLAP